jgi:hypothetical protein
MWRRYATATAIHVRLDHKLRFAALQGDYDVIESLTLETEGAEGIRLGLREAIRRHEQSHQSSRANSARHQ